MTNQTQDYDIAAIRKLLLAAFTPDDLRHFCHDRHTFRPVVNRFGSGHGLDDMADELITYCEKYLLLPELLTELKQHNPRQYARFIEPELSQHEPAPPTPEILTISHPISLLLVRIPAGEFQMGSVTSRDNDARDDELPPHPVHLPEFHISKYPVTNTQYQAFVRAIRHRVPLHWEKGEIARRKSNHPVVNVSWKDALAFCTWLSQESGQPFRLPTEAEWEKAARGTDGRINPWGDEPPDENLCNCNMNVGDTTTIGRYSPQGDSPYGCADMAGNVWEWCQSLNRPYPYSMDDGRETLEAEDHRVLRGGSFYDPQGLVRCAYRHGSYPDLRHWNYGLRLVVAPGPSDL
jgi:formylglycine-generating enzyme required for sulfatase activity